MSLAGSSTDHAQQPPTEPGTVHLGKPEAEASTGPLGIQTRSRAQTCVITVAGELDVATAPELMATLRDLLTEAPQRLVIDLDQVTFLDSSGLGVLVTAYRRMVADAGEFVLVCHNRNCLRVMEITALTRLFGFASSVEEAVTGPRAYTDPSSVLG